MDLDTFLEFMINELEGGAKKHINHGETHYTSYGVYGKYHKLPKSMAEAKQFYKNEFFVNRFEDNDMNLFLLQFSVNVGKERALSLIEKNLVLDIIELSNIQLTYYKKLKQYKFFGGGWINRVSKSLKYLGYID